MGRLRFAGLGLATLLIACGKASSDEELGSSNAGSGGSAGSEGGSGGSGEAPGTSCPGTDAPAPARDPAAAPLAAEALCSEPGTPIDVLDRNIAHTELLGRWVCCASSPAPLEPQWTPAPCELFGSSHQAIEFLSDQRWRFLTFSGDTLVAEAGGGTWRIGGGTPEHGGLTCPLFLELSSPGAAEEASFRFTRSPTKLWLSLRSAGRGPHYAATTAN